MMAKWIRLQYDKTFAIPLTEVRLLCRHYSSRFHIDRPIVVEAIRKAPLNKEGKRLFDVGELEWFARNSYNLGLKHASDWNLQHIVQMLTSCVNIMNAFPGDLPGDIAGDLSLKRLFCHFTVASALVSQARSEDDTQRQLQYYGQVRNSVAAFDSELQVILEKQDGKTAEDLLEKLSILFVFDFEAAASLGDWKYIGEIVRKAAVCKSVSTFLAMGDCLLRSKAPHEGE
jgi:hypothetical protein